MPKTLHLLLTHYGDYNCDYEQFLRDNRELLAGGGIACPWIAKSSRDAGWEHLLPDKLKAIRNGAADLAEELATALAPCDGILLAAPVSSMWRIVQELRAVTRGDARFSAWADPVVRIVWLARERAREAEGGIAYNLPADSIESSYRFAMTGRDAWLEQLDALLGMAASRAILEDTGPAHVRMATVLEKLAIPVPFAACAPLRETRPLSRAALWLRARLRLLLPSDNDDISTLPPEALPPDDGGFLGPDRHNALHAAYTPGMKSIAAKYGHALTLPAPETADGWRPFTPPAPAACRKVYEAWLEAQPAEEREFSLRLLENAWDTGWLTGDAPAYAAALRVRHGIPQPEAPRLSVLTLTKNHERFIGACIDSVLMQRTTFPVRHIILDDHSTDGTRRIVENYARRHPSIWPVFMPARHQPGDNVRALYSRCVTPYAALCEGDDYFTDAEKLQLQVEFLDSNPECALCFHPVLVMFEDSSENNFIFPPPKGLPRGITKRYYLADLAKNNFIQTNSVVYRWRFAQGLPEWFRADVCPGDWYCHLLHAETGKIGFLPRIMSVYRRHASALYANAFVHPDRHWRVHGMNELQAFHVFNEHFQGRYFRTLSMLADQVLTSFLQDKLDGDDAGLLDKACAAYPEFGLNFLKNINITHVRRPRTENGGKAGGTAPCDEGPDRRQRRPATGPAR